jgi:1-acyl-sn-glycerol-3-phosphate acyltransferase
VITASKQPLVSWAWRRYVSSKVRAAFRAVWVSGALPRGPAPIIVYANHTNFWDGFVAHEVMRHAERDVYAMMEEVNLQRYRFLRRLGAFSVRRGSASSARESLRHASELLRRPSASVLIFPQGSIQPFEAPLKFERGVELLSRMTGARCVPLAIRYAVFEHEFPDVLVGVGEAHECESSDSMAQRLTVLRDALSSRQSPDGLEPMVRGRASVAQRWDAARGLA